MALLKKIKINNDEYTIRDPSAVQQDNIKTINGESILGSGDIDTYKVKRFEDEDWLNYTLANSSNPELPYRSYLHGFLYDSCRDDPGGKPSALAGYLTETYTRRTAYSLTDTELGKIWAARFDDLTEEIGKPVFFDLSNNKVYVCSLRYSVVGWTTTMTGFDVDRACDFTFDSKQVYSIDQIFGTHIYFTMNLVHYKKVPNTTLGSLDETAWLYSISLRHVYHETVNHEEKLFNQIITMLNNSESVDKWANSDYTDDNCYFYNGWGYQDPQSLSNGQVCALYTPCVFWDLTGYGGLPRLLVRGFIESQYFIYDSAMNLMNEVPISGRFIAGMDNMPLRIRADVIIADNNPAILANHTYEFNIYQREFHLIDVTGSISDY